MFIWYYLWARLCKIPGKQQWEYTNIVPCCMPGNLQASQGEDVIQMIEGDLESGAFLFSSLLYSQCIGGYWAAK